MIAMGLDISVFATATLKPGAEEDGDTLVRLYVDHRPQADGMVDGVYEVEGGCCHAFQAGSYSGYNRWREGLAALVGTTPKELWNGGSGVVKFH